MWHNYVVLAILNADIADERVIPHEKPLVYEQNFQRSTFLKLINGATQTIDIHKQSVQDDGITKAIVGAAKAGIIIENQTQIKLIKNQFEKDWAQSIITSNLR